MVVVDIAARAEPWCHDPVDPCISFTYMASDTKPFFDVTSAIVHLPRPGLRVRDMESISASRTDRVGPVLVDQVTCLLMVVWNFLAMASLADPVRITSVGCIVRARA